VGVLLLVLSVLVLLLLLVLSVSDEDIELVGWLVGYVILETRRRNV
jgi:hypothetical protein